MQASANHCQQLQSLRDLPFKKAALLDQFGVLHDGKKPYPGAIEAVRHLADQGTKILILSNSSRRAAGALTNLHRMGFPEHAFFGAITSGEVTHQNLLHRPTPFWQARRRCLHLTWAARGAISLQGLGIDVTTDPLEADCIIAHGTEALGTQTDGENAAPHTLDQLKDIVLKCAQLTPPVPMIVANPDRVTVYGTELRTMPGTIAQWYAEAGGEVHLMGKPAAPIYTTALAMLNDTCTNGETLSIDDIIAIGDSFEHDIAGASTAGITCLFIAGGIHADVFIDETNDIHVDKVIELCRACDVKHPPKYMLPYFCL